MKPKVAITSNWNPFPNEGAKYAYILVYTDGTTRSNLLRITVRLYYDSNLAKKWFDTINSAIIAAADSIPADIVQVAKAILTEFYEHMIEPNDDSEDDYDE